MIMAGEVMVVVMVVVATSECKSARVDTVQEIKGGCPRTAHYILLMVIGSV